MSIEDRIADFTNGELHELRELLLAGLKNEIRVNAEDGVNCLCCGRLTKVYKRVLNKSMTLVLLLMSKEKDDWIKVEEMIGRKMPSKVSKLRADFHKLKYWSLIEPKDELRDDGSNRNGYYRLTEKGRNFANGIISVPKWVKLINGDVHAWSQDLVDIDSTFGNSFSYKEIMS